MDDLDSLFTRYLDEENFKENARQNMLLLSREKKREIIGMWKKQQDSKKQQEPTSRRTSFLPKISTLVKTNSSSSSKSLSSINIDEEFAQVLKSIGLDSKIIKQSVKKYTIEQKQNAIMLHREKRADAGSSRSSISSPFPEQGPELHRLFELTLDELQVDGKARITLLQETNDIEMREIIMRNAKLRSARRNSNASSISAPQSPERSDSLLYSQAQTGTLKGLKDLILAAERTPVFYLQYLSSRNTSLKLLFKLLIELRLKLSLYRDWAKTFLEAATPFDGDVLSKINGSQIFALILERILLITSQKTKLDFMTYSSNYFDYLCIQMDKSSYSNFIPENDCRIEALLGIQVLMDACPEVHSLVIKQVIYAMLFAQRDDASRLQVLATDILANIVYLMPFDTGLSNILIFFKEASELAKNPSSLSILISNLESSDWELKVSTLTLINSIMVKFQEDFEGRIQFRREIESMGLVSLITILSDDPRASEDFLNQCDIYIDDQACDLDDMERQYQEKIDQEFSNPSKLANDVVINSAKLVDSQARYLYLSTVSCISESANTLSKLDPRVLLGDLEYLNALVIQFSSSISNGEPISRGKFVDSSNNHPELDDLKMKLQEEKFLCEQYRKEIALLLERVGRNDKPLAMLDDRTNHELAELAKENDRLRSAAYFGRVKISDMNVEDMIKVEKFIEEIQKQKFDSQAISQPAQFIIPTAPGQAPPPPKLAASNLLNLNWTRLDPKKGSIWSSKPKSTISLDADEVSKLFAKQSTTPPRSNAISSPKFIQFIPLQRARNIGIMLKGIRSSPLQIRYAVLSIDDEALTLSKLALIKRYTPLPEEFEALSSYSELQGPLAIAEQYIQQLSLIPRIEKRLDCMLYRRGLTEELNIIEPDLTSFITCCEQVFKSSNLKWIMCALLDFGNFINAGGYRGMAGGFKTDAFDSLDMKLTQGRWPTALHYFVHLCNEESIDFLDEVPDCLLASSIGVRSLLDSAKDIRKGFSDTVNEFELLQKNGVADGDMFLVRFKAFLVSFSPKIEALDNQIKSAEDNLKNLLLYFGEDATFEFPEKLFKDLHSFGQRLKKTKGENAVIEAEFEKNNTSQLSGLIKEGRSLLKPVPGQQPFSLRKTVRNAGNFEQTRLKLRQGTVLQSKRTMLRRQPTCNESYTDIFNDIEITDHDAELMKEFGL